MSLLYKPSPPFARNSKGGAFKVFDLLSLLKFVW